MHVSPAANTTTASRARDHDHTDPRTVTDSDFAAIPVLLRFMTLPRRVQP